MFKNKASKLILIIIIMFILLTIVIISYNKNNDKNKIIKDISIEKNNNKIKKDNVLSHEKVEKDNEKTNDNIIEKPNTNVETNQNTSDEITTKSDSIEKEDDNQNIIKENNSNSTTVENQEKIEETTSYIGVPDPNSFNYSFHKGIIEYNSREECITKGTDIAFIDTVDIKNFWCFDVVDSNSTVLGYYLYINCLSEDCNKYKNY